MRPPTVQHSKHGQRAEPHRSATARRKQSRGARRCELRSGRSRSATTKGTTGHKASAKRASESNASAGRSRSRTAASSSACRRVSSGGPHSARRRQPGSALPTTSSAGETRHLVEYRIGGRDTKTCHARRSGRSGSRRSAPDGSRANPPPSASPRSGSSSRSQSSRRRCGRRPNAGRPRALTSPRRRQCSTGPRSIVRYRSSATAGRRDHSRRRRRPRRAPVRRGESSRVDPQDRDRAGDGVRLRGRSPRTRPATGPVSFRAKSPRSRTRRAPSTSRPSTG